MICARQDTESQPRDWSPARDDRHSATAYGICAASEVGLLAKKALRDRAAGQVVAVFERSFYVVIDGTWVCVGQTGIGSGPLHLLGNFRWSRVGVGDPARIAGSVLWVAGTPLATLSSASVWTPGAAPRWSENSLRRGLHAVDDMWTDGLTAHGLAVVGSEGFPREVSALVRAAMPGLLALAHFVAGTAYYGDQMTRLGSLIGLGPGLTPSGDDLIGGALIALAALGQIERRDVLWHHCGALLDGTNDISRIHLRAAALGYGAAALHAAIHATMSGDVTRLRHAIDALTGVGHTSGLDAFAGSLIVLRHAARKR
jgi:hypothetical protein